MQGRSYDISGVSVPIPQAGTTVSISGVKIDPKALQNASDATQQADQKYTRLCSLLPMYSHDQAAFYKARDQMFDLIAGTTEIAKQVANTTGQPQPANPPTVPTAAPTAATSAGTNPTKAVANPASKPAPSVPTTASTDQTPKKASLADNKKLNSLANKLKKLAAKKVSTNP